MTITQFSRQSPRPRWPTPGGGAVLTAILVFGTPGVALPLVQPHHDLMGGCLDVVADCEAKGDGRSDDTAAFNHCIVMATGATGCVYVPAKSFGVTGVAINVSDVQLWIAAGATLLPPAGVTAGIEGLVLIGSAVDPAPAHNVSVVGVGGQFVLDCTLQGVTNNKIGALRLNGNVRDFVIGNVRTKMAYGQNTTSKSKDLNTNALGMGNLLANGTSYHPTNGHVFNITNTGSWGGYGLVQVQSAENILFEHLDSTGGVTLRMETGVQLPGSYVGNITGRDLTCRNGSSAFLANPHGQKNGDFFVYDVKSYSCFMGIDITPGYIQNTTTPGYYGNNSLVHGVVATYGAHGAQCDSLCKANKHFGSSCAACYYGENSANPDSLNYKVDVQNVVGVGFPWKYNYSECAAFNRHDEVCTYWPPSNPSRM